MGIAPTLGGIGTFTAGTGDISVPVPASYSVGDLFILLVNSANQTISTPSGWTQVANSPQGTGSVGAAGGVALAAFWKIAASGESAVTITDTGSYTAGQMFSFYRHDPDNPIHATAGSVQATAATSWTCPEVTTTIPNCHILLCVGNDRDASADNTSLSGWTNPNLTSFSERADKTSNAGVGGGIGLASGYMATPGATGTTAVTSSTSNTAAFITIAIAPITVFSDGRTESAATSESSNGVKNLTDAAQSESVTPSEASGAEPPPVTRVGDAVNLTTSSLSGSTTVTVPTGASFAVLILGGGGNLNWYDIPYPFGSSGLSASLGGRSFTYRNGIPSNIYGAPRLAFWTLSTIEAGDRTFTWAIGSNIPTGIFFSIIFYKNVSASSPVKAFDYEYSYAISRDRMLLPQMSSSFGDMTVAACVKDEKSYQPYQTQELLLEGIDPLVGTGLYFYNYQRLGSVTVIDSWYSTTRAIAGIVLRQGIDSVAYSDATTETASATDAYLSVAVGESEETATAEDSEEALTTMVVAENVQPYQFSGQYANLLGETPIVIYTMTQVNLNYPIEIPAGTSVILAFFCTAEFYGGDEYYRFTLGDYTFEHVDNNTYQAVAKLINPPAGSQIFGWDLAANPEYLGSHIVLACIANVDTSADPVISSGHTSLYPGNSNITGLTYEGAKDICVGLVSCNSPVWNMITSGLPAEFPLMPRGIQARFNPSIGHNEKTLYSQLGANWETTVFLAGVYSIFTDVMAIAVVLRGLDLGSIEQGGFDRGLSEDVAASDTVIAPNTTDRAAADSVTIRDIVGPYVDIPEKFLFSDTFYRPYHFAEDRLNPYDQWYFSPAEGVNLLIVAYSTSRPESTWHYEGNYTLTMNGVPFTHLFNTVAAARNLTVAYLKNPTPGLIVSNFPNPYLPREDGDLSEPPDMWLMNQFIGVDVSGDPIRSYAYSADVDTLGINAVSGLTFVEGDLTLAVCTGAFTAYPTIGTRRGTTAWSANSVEGWYMALGSGAIPAGADSISAVANAVINMLGLVIKLDPEFGNVIDTTTTAIQTDDLTPSDAWTGTMDAVAAIDQAATASEGWTGIIDSVNTVSGSCELTVETTSYGVRTAAAFFGRMDVIDVSDIISAWAVGYAGAEETVLAGEGQEGFRLTYDGITEGGLVLGDLVTAERFVEGTVAELSTAGDDPVAVMVCWAFAVDASMVLDGPTATADIYPSVVEISTIIDGYSAILIECYFPEMTVTYGKTEYQAVFEAPTITAALREDGIMATLQQDNETEAIFTGGEQVAALEDSVIEAVLEGMIVATLEPSAYIATKGD